MPTHSDTAPRVRRRWAAPVVLGLTTVLATLTTGTAATAAPERTRPPAPSAGSVREFLDTAIPEQLDRYRIPGAAVVVVADGRVIATRGYGTADVARQLPVDPHRTAFFMASVAKLFTATAVLQLADAGKLDLHADVNRYLPARFRIADTYPRRPITLHHLLTHTSGFAQRIVGAGSTDPRSVEPLGRYLATHQPERIRPPGQLPAYDNYGMALAGYVVEVVSGQPFETYVQRNILAPLGMHDTTFGQPTPDTVSANLARGYRPTGTRQVVARGQYGPMAPTGAGTVTTVADMGRFMLSQLGSGPQVLSAPWLRELQHRQFGVDPRLPGMAYAYEQHPHSGQRIVSKTGDVPGFHGNLALLPDQDTGIYVVYNGDGTDGSAAFAAHELTARFVDRFFPGGSPPGEVRSGRTAENRAVPEGTWSGDRADTADLVGDYRTTRISDRDWTNASNLLGGVRVTSDGPGRIRTVGLPSAPGKTVQHWIRVGPGLFAEPGGTDRISFTADGTLVAGAVPTAAYEPLAWYSSPRLHQAVLAGALVVLLTGLFGWPLAALLRRLRRRPARAGSRTARWVAVATGVLLISFLATFVVVVADPNAMNETVLLGGSPLLHTALTMLTVAALGAAGCLVLAVAAWLRGWWSVLARVHYSIVAIAAAGFVAVANAYNLVGWPLV